MITELGAFALILSLMLSVTQTGLSAVGGARRSPVLAGAGRGAAVATFIAVAVAFAALIHAFVTSDFSVANVAANSHTAKPLFYKVAGAWGSHEGSMLLWCLVLTGYGAAMAFSAIACRRACGPTPSPSRARWACCSWPTPSLPRTRWRVCWTSRSRAGR
jgi:cytochrome c-type biogenesis protein CcmF